MNHATYRAARAFGLASLFLASVVNATGLFGSQSAGAQNPGPQMDPGEHPAVLQGQVKRTTEPQNLIPVSLSTSINGGMVESAAGHAPLSGVTVSVPNMNFKTVSGKDGRFSLPQLPRKPVIVSFQKQGYVPVTVTLDQDTIKRHPLIISLSALQNTLIVDQQIRHLGDGSFSPVSAGAGKFQRDSEGPALRRSFVLDRPIDGMAVLEIGSVIGLDTQAAHAVGQSSFHRMSTPMQVLLNGELIGEITINGDRQRIVIPEGLLRPNSPNTLEIRTGYRNTGSGLDYDDMELMLVTITLHRV